jgi:hypothetical protein
MVAAVDHSDLMCLLLRLVAAGILKRPEALPNFHSTILHSAIF